MFPAGIKVREVLEKKEFPGDTHPVVAAFVNNHAESLDYHLRINCRVSTITLESEEGTSIYRRSLCFLLTVTSQELFPDRRLIVGHALGKGFYYHYANLEAIDPAELAALKKRMLELANANLPIQRKVISFQEAAAYFETSGQTDTAQLLKYRNESKVYTNSCASFMDLYHGPLVPCTGMLQVFDIMDYPPGFLLRYFSQGKPEELPPFKEDPILFKIYQEYKSWGKILNMHCVGALNELVTTRRCREFIEVAEALHNKKISRIADQIAERSPRVKLILIAGPSSSGKTTFAKKLAIQLKVLGLQPLPVSIDNYFINRAQVPLDEHGQPDLESLGALDVELLNHHLMELFDGKKVTLPEFDFARGLQKEGNQTIRLTDSTLLICEGIHCLNDQLTSRVPAGAKFKIYVSALTQLNLDDHNRISTTENRLIRRLVRDNQFRGYAAAETLGMWASVRRGEDKNIFPYQNSAESAFNSALDYELAVLKIYAEPLLKTVKPNIPVYNLARRLLFFLNNFIPMPASWVPGDSILREFIGEGTFKY